MAKEAERGDPHARARHVVHVPQAQEAARCQGGGASHGPCPVPVPGLARRSPSLPADTQQAQGTLTRSGPHRRTSAGTRRACVRTGKREGACVANPAATFAGAAGDTDVPHLALCVPEAAVGGGCGRHRRVRHKQVVGATARKRDVCPPPHKVATAGTHTEAALRGPAVRGRASSWEPRGEELPRCWWGLSKQTAYLQPCAPQDTAATAGC
jgi:hypothetical protein